MSPKGDFRRGYMPVGGVVRNARGGAGSTRWAGSLSFGASLAEGETLGGALRPVSTI